VVETGLHAAGLDPTLIVLVVGEHDLACVLARLHVVHRFLRSVHGVGGAGQSLELPSSAEDVTIDVLLSSSMSTMMKEQLRTVVISPIDAFLNNGTVTCCQSANRQSLTQALKHSDSF
jgi:hypothetical protein